MPPRKKPTIGASTGAVAASDAHENVPPSGDSARETDNGPSHTARTPIRATGPSNNAGIDTGEERVKGASPLTPLPRSKDDLEEEGEQPSPSRQGSKQPVRSESAIASIADKPRVGGVTAPRDVTVASSSNDNGTTNVNTSGNRPLSESIKTIVDSQRRIARQFEESEARLL